MTKKKFIRIVIGLPILAVLIIGIANGIFSLKNDVFIFDYLEIKHGILSNGNQSISRIEYKKKENVLNITVFSECTGYNQIDEMYHAISFLDKYKMDKFGFIQKKQCDYQVTIYNDTSNLRLPVSTITVFNSFCYSDNNYATLHMECWKSQELPEFDNTTNKKLTVSKLYFTRSTSKYDTYPYVSSDILYGFNDIRELDLCHAELTEQELNEIKKHIDSTCEITGYTIT